MLKRELEWIQSSPKARQTKSKARIKSYNEMRDEAEREQVFWFLRHGCRLLKFACICKYIYAILYTWDGR